MVDKFKYRVRPLEPKFEAVALTKNDRKEVTGLSFGAGFVIWIVVFLAIALGVAGVTASYGFTLIDGDSRAAVAIIAVIASLAVGLIAYSTKSIKVSIVQRKRAEQAKANHQAAISHAEHEASSLTSRLISTYELSASSVAELGQHLDRASRLLEHAENEYRANAFAPFWDAVEKAAQQLSAFNDQTNELSKNASHYYSELSGREHTFPAFPVQRRALPDATTVVSEFRRVVRLGLTSPTFAIIWEHYKDRKVMMAGFRSLGEAVNNLGTTLENSIYNLQETVSSDLAGVMQEEIKTRESLDKRMAEQNRMLDDLQHHRKPSP